MLVPCVLAKLGELMLKFDPPDYSVFRTYPDSENEQKTHLPLGPGVLVNYHYQKSSDAQAIGARNEDAIAWEVDPAGQILSFAVCDGVSGSYLGYVAANFLAITLAHTLKEWIEGSA